MGEMKQLPAIEVPQRNFEPCGDQAFKRSQWKLVISWPGYRDWCHTFSMVDPTGQKYPLEYFAVQIAPLILQFVEEHENVEPEAAHAKWAVGNGPDRWSVKDIYLLTLRRKKCHYCQVDLEVRPDSPDDVRFSPERWP